MPAARKQTQTYILQMCIVTKMQKSSTETSIRTKYTRSETVKLTKLLKFTTDVKQTTHEIKNC